MADAVIVRTVEQAVGLREGGAVAGRDVLATYHSELNGVAFALCPNGLLLQHDNRWRYIDYGDVEAVELPAEVKTSMENRRLTLVLVSGERVQVPVDGEHNGFLDVFPIHAFVRRRVHQRKVFNRKL